MIHKKYEAVLFSFIMATFMCGFMSLVITYINIGIVDSFISFWLDAYWKAFIIAFPTIFVVVPNVKKIVSYLIVKP